MLERFVHHERYGQGLVKRTRNKGFQLQIKFDTSFTRWVRLDELAETEVNNSVDLPELDSVDLPELERDDDSSRPLLNQNPTVVLDDKPKIETIRELDRFKSRRMIEAFRLGIVPYDCVQDFIYGRSGEMAYFTDWLENPNSNSLMVVGEYGTGKTHLLHYAYGRAIQEGFAVALVEMDANESPFHRPKQVYSRLVRSLQFHHTEVGQPQTLGFRDFIQEALARGAFDDHTYFKCLIDRRLDETLWEWIEARDVSLRPPNLYQKTKINTNWRDFNAAERNLRRMGEVLREVERLVDGSGSRLPGSYLKLPGLYPYYKAANIYCYLLSALGWAAKELFGLKGLLLIFDEAETVDTYDNLYQADKSQNFLKALIRTASSDDLLRHPPKETGLDYCRVGIASSIPFLYKQPSGLKLFFAMTPIHPRRSGILSDVSSELENSSRIELEPLMEDAQKDLFQHIHRLYKCAYHDFKEDLRPDTIEAIFRRITGQSGLTRLFVKGTVEAFDLIRTGQMHGIEFDEV